MEELTVSVERKHIDGCDPKSAFNCAIAKALKEQHPRDWLWSVVLVVAPNGVFGQICRWPGKPVNLPPIATVFLRDIMAGKPVGPITFTVKV